MQFSPTAARVAFSAALLLLFPMSVPSAHAAPRAATTATTLEGELEVLVEDYADGHSRERHFLKTEQRRFELKSEGKRNGLLSGARVRVRGQLAGETLALSSDSGSVQVVQAALPYTMGEQRTAVILVNFQDNAPQPMTATAVNDLVFGTVNNFYKEASFQQTWLTGDTFGWYTIPVSSATCDTASIYTEAQKAVAASGVDLSTYKRTIFMFPTISACGWAGSGNVGGAKTNAWINGSFTLHTIGHELGHNQGLSHAHSRDCGSTTLGASCTVADYGDVIDIMGSLRAGQFSPFQKELMGWLNDGVSPPIHTANVSGRYSIEPYSSSSVGPKAIKIPRGVDSSGKQLWYYIEYRQPIGADAMLGSVGNLTRGVIVRLATEGDRYSSDLLDTTPASYITTNGDFQDGALAVGQTYSEAAANVSFTLVSADANGATLDVSIGSGGSTPTCTRAAPVVSVSGPATAVAAGTAVNYAVSVTNKDSSACSATSFSLARSVPSGWSGTLAATSLTLSPGASASTTLGVVSAGTAAAGSYGIGVGVSSSTGAIHTTSASGNYTVSAPTGTLSEAVATDKASYARGETVYMSALVKKDGVATAGASVKFTVTLPSGSTTVVSASSGSDGYARATYRTAKGKGAAGNYGLRAEAVLGGTAASASGSFRVL
ncbi:NEW3 domain-containing protein [Lysobacter solisilvae (ex Woo and Kim 2020)]|uniref:Peptidase M11 n=1 Tax=Agrilutibacter terrestris TaxID=2865112 RepID=A0A7H0G0G1_9GAMM|nr:NEW3 domain-containing protein [Lysobacter terrestris]QNP41777.1 peptidase M11 [Lysobacter terrestris]